jgi:large subunit ribosomal protein L4
MEKLPIFDLSGKQTSSVALPQSVFAYAGKEHLLYEAVVNFLANQRQGTAATKTRGEVRGGGKKPWRQKGTGRARAGSIRSPLWRKGGTVFGPVPRDYGYEMPRQARRNALKLALAQKRAEERLLVLDDITLNEPKTKAAAALLKTFNLDSALLVDRKDNRNLFIAARNLPEAKVVDVGSLNVYDVLRYKWLVFSRRAFESAMERLK